MKNRLLATDFDFEYTGSITTEKEVIENGLPQLTAKELHSRISNKTIFGDYPKGFKFVTNIYENGSAEGVNDVGAQDYGNWTIDYEKNTLQLTWENGWFNTITRAYDINGTIQFYDTDSGNWRTSFRIFKNLEDK